MEPIRKRIPSNFQKFRSSNQATLSQLLDTVSPLLQRRTSLLLVCTQTPWLLLAISYAVWKWWASTNNFVPNETNDSTLTCTRVAILNYRVVFPSPTSWIVFDDEVLLTRWCCPIRFDHQHKNGQSVEKLCKKMSVNWTTTMYTIARYRARQLIANIIRFLGHVSIILQKNDENNLVKIACGWQRMSSKRVSAAHTRGVTRLDTPDRKKWTHCFQTKIL